MILGIDPGLDGALCLYDPFEPLQVWDMPTRERKVNGKLKRFVDLDALAQLIADMNDIDAAAVERVAASPQMGVTSAYNFGFGVGAIEMALHMRGIKVIASYPSSVWKPAMGLTRDKNDSRALAIKLSGDTSTFARVKDDGRAEAYLIARFAYANLTRTKEQAPV